MGKKENSYKTVNGVHDSHGEVFGKVSSFRMFTKKMCGCLKCIKDSRNERIFQKGKKQLSKELDIVKFLKLVREVKAFVKFSVSKEDRKNYLKPSRMYYVNSGDNNDDSDVTEQVN